MMAKMMETMDNNTKCMMNLVELMMEEETADTEEATTVSAEDTVEKKAADMEKAADT